MSVSVSAAETYISVSVSENVSVSVSVSVSYVYVSDSESKGSGSGSDVTVTIFTDPTIIGKGTGQWYYADQQEFRFDGIKAVDSNGDDRTAELEFAAAKPGDLYDGKTFDYTVDLLIDGEVVGTVPVKIGLRGDASLDHKISAKDASVIFTAYKLVYSGKDDGIDDWQFFLGNVDSDQNKSGSTKISAQDASYVFSLYKAVYGGDKNATYPFLNTTIYGK